ncbi:MAG: valine--tRNA ligase [Candidatus Fischerbacteria bacterium RBG_13_37_8]|uniref:Valine--tRNA ligase n=1 Tax=Candidatus Fischerbacteria bacterium RBG_13_37_8 TaxID=1817863 RepID=A0A1F5VU63_9BACT|nr:MAG: valine--tRNA ligase [Candidatus Fischerbacteria bacterium RBG_13_37_8]
MILEKAYEHKEIEKKWMEFWLNSTIFQVGQVVQGKRFSIVIPPPNITGGLHIGHGLQYTLHDVYTRWKRMKGCTSLWVPGMDHAGIATQYIMEKELAKENVTREQLGRDKFIERVWQWAGAAMDRIKFQLMKLGSSCDWSHQHFTLNDDLTRAVLEAFVRLYQERLIYRAEYIINWCPRCLTALSDLETIHKEYSGKLFYIRYPLKSGQGYVEVATTRPETIPGDTAVGVNPNDERYKVAIGDYVILPVLKREIPIIADEAVDPAFGTGAVKITPGHDPDDFEIGKRHKLASITIMTDSAKMNEQSGPYEGQDRFVCRKNILSDLANEGLLAKEEDYAYSIGHCFRCDTIVEPRVSKQWFVRMKPLAEPAIKAVEDGRVELVPSNWNKVYYDWLNNIRDWCISRQIWWGHQIPAYYCQDCSELTVSVTRPLKCQQCNSTSLIQDEDVLDTWFSSALWPFTVFGWPEKTVDLKQYYPTNLLITGYDILFFWVARMIMMGLKFMNDVPFKQVLFTGLIRDEKGNKMSRTKGNVVDPLEVIDNMGADALRFTLISQTADAMDVSFSRNKVQGNRAFMNKLWNVSRFVLMNIPDEFMVKPLRAEDLSLFDRWILTRTNEIIQEVDHNLTYYELSKAGNLLYHFIWNEFCDWYVEFSKPYLNAPDEKRKETTLNVLAVVLGKILKVLHPFTPFITEELWSIVKKLFKEDKTLALTAMPEYVETEVFAESKEEITAIQDVISRVRQIRAEMNIAPQKEVSCYVKIAEDKYGELFTYALPQILFLAKLKEFFLAAEFPADKMLVKDSAPCAHIGVDLLESVDRDKETARIEKEISKLEKTLNDVTAKLIDKNIIEKAPREVIESFQNRKDETQLRLNRLRAHLHDLQK